MEEKKSLLRCPFCGGEGFIYNVVPNYAWWACKCASCGAETSSYHTEAEAIEAWNRRDERTAKVEELLRRSETSLDWEGICSNCGAYTNHDMNYCFECGARLEWE